jgi:transposase
MWTVENRARYDRSKLRYPSDLTDEEWALAKPHIPRAKRGGNKRTVDVREVLNGLMYVLSTGCQWRAIPKDLPPRSTVNFYFCRGQLRPDKTRRGALRFGRLRKLGPAACRAAWPAA